MIKLKRSVFLKLFQDRWVLWDYDQHKQYEIDREHFCALFDLVNPALEPFAHSHPIANFIGKGLAFSEGAIHQLSHLNERNNPARGLNAGNSELGWDELSHMFHFGTSDVQSPWIDRDEEVFIDE